MIICQVVFAKSFLKTNTDKKKNYSEAVGCWMNSAGGVDEGGDCIIAACLQQYDYELCAGSNNMKTLQTDWSTEKT